MLLLGASINDTRRVVQLGFAAVLILVLVYATTSLYQIRQSTNHLTEIVEINNAKITHLYHMRDVIRQRQIILNFMLSTKDTFLREEKSLEFFSIAGKFRESREKLQALSNNKQEKVLLDNLVRLIRIGQPINQKAVSSMVSGFDSNRVRELSMKAQSAQLGIIDTMDALIALQEQYEAKYVAESKQGYESIFFWSILSAVFLIALAAIISAIVSGFVEQKNTELTKKNLELEKVSELALEATRTKSAFLATMSHEIRTPLTAIIGFAEMNLHDVIPKDNRKKYSESILRNGKHLLQVINDILDISKLEADRIEFEEVKFSPIKILQEVEQNLLPQVNKKGLFLDVNYIYPLPEYITGDALRFKQVILNLCSNAIKFTEAGRINIKLSCDIDDNKLYVEVVDTGIGMTDEQVEKVFDAFTQADSTVSRKYGGTGLGLALSKQFIEKMGGKIGAHSVLGIGSRFIITVNTGNISSVKLIHSKPSSQSYIQPALHESVEIRQVEGDILLVEDNLDNQQLFKLLLDKTGANVQVASNGKEAVDAAMAKPFNLIFMDMQMPIMDGVEATRVLRQKGYDGSIISLTANAMKQDREACFEAGCNDYITKPVSEKTLYDTVYEYLEIVEVNGGNNTDNSSQFNDSDVVELKEKFILNLPSKVELIKKCFKGGDFDCVKSEIHKLKGLGGAIGLPEITNISLKIEQSVARNDTYQCENLINELEQMVQRIDIKEHEKKY